jgi:hypothetical protein
MHIVKNILPQLESFGIIPLHQNKARETPLLRVIAQRQPRNMTNETKSTVT